MRIAIITPGGVDPSGTHRVIPCLLWLIARLATTHDVHVFSLFHPTDPPVFSWCGATVHTVGRPWSRWKLVRAIMREHRRGAFDVVHAFWVTAGAVAALVRRLTGVPALVHIAGGELVALPEIAYGGLCTTRGRLQARVALRGADLLTAQTETARATARNLGRDAQRFVLGVDLDEWPPQPPRPRPLAEPARLVHVASLNRVKDQATLVRALRILAERGADFSIDIIGEDTLDGAVQQLVTDVGLADRVTFHGFKPNGEVRAIVERAHLAVLTSRYEAAGIVTLEAAVVGVPSVGTAVGHIGEWDPGRALAAPVGDAPGVADRMMQLLTDESRRLAVAREAQTWAVTHDADATADAAVRYYRTVSERR